MVQNYNIISSISPFILDLELFNYGFVFDGESDFSRKRRIEFFIDCGNYFTNLATILDLIAQDKKNFRRRNYSEVLARCKNDLLFLEEKYKIVPKET